MAFVISCICLPPAFCILHSRVVRPPLARRPLHTRKTRNRPGLSSPSFSSFLPTPCAFHMRTIFLAPRQHLCFLFTFQPFTSRAPRLLLVISITSAPLHTSSPSTHLYQAPCNTLSIRIHYKSPIANRLSSSQQPFHPTVNSTSSLRQQQSQTAQQTITARRTPIYLLDVTISSFHSPLSAFRARQSTGAHQHLSSSATVHIAPLDEHHPIFTTLPSYTPIIPVVPPHRLPGLIIAANSLD